MYVSDTSSRFSRGMSTPAIRAISIAPFAAAQDTGAAAARSACSAARRPFGPVLASRYSRSSSPLPLLVARVTADDPHRAVPADHLALLAHLLDRRTDLHRSLLVPVGDPA